MMCSLGLVFSICEELCVCVCMYVTCCVVIKHASFLFSVTSCSEQCQSREEEEGIERNERAVGRRK